MKKERKSTQLLTNFTFSKAEPLKNNPLISKVKIKIAEPGRNRNGSIIRKNVLLQGARDTLGLAPIVAYYSKNTGDFGQHGEQAERVGNDYIISDTQAFGVIPENPEIFWEDGFLSVYGYMWTERYPFLYEAMSKSKHHSMELDMGRTEIGDRTPDGYYDLPKIAFSGLCILGDDIEPAFAESRISMEYSLKGEDKYMEELLFALGKTEGPDFLVENLSREQLEEYVNRITDTINRLDEVASESESDENVEIIDDIITKLVAIENELKGEPKLVPLSEKAIEALQGEVTHEDGIVTNSYQKKEEFSPMTEEEKRRLQEQEEAKKAEAPVAEEENNTEVPVAEDDKENPEQDTEVVAEEPENGTGEGEGKPVKPEEQPQEGTPESEVGTKGEGVQEESPTVGTPRETANLKRAKAVVGDIATDDLLEIIVQRFGNLEEGKAKLAQVLDIDITAGSEVLPENAQSVDINTVEPGDISGESVMTQEADASVAETVPTGGETAQPTEQGDADGNSQSTGGPAEVTTESGDSEDTVAQEKDKEVPSEDKKEEDDSNIPVAEDEKKKKEQFSLDVKELVAHTESILAENTALKDENKALREFKLNIEKEEKEKELLSYSLKEEINEEIRSQFDTLSVQEVSEKAAYAHYRQTLVPETGQKSDNAPIEFSLTAEEDLSNGDSNSSVLRALSRIKNHQNG